MIVVLEEIKKHKLEDDDTPYGGTSFAGETVRDFLDSAGEISGVLTDGFVNLDKLNASLKQCGIKPLCIKYRDGVSF